MKVGRENQSFNTTNCGKVQVLWIFLKIIPPCSCHAASKWNLLVHSQLQLFFKVHDDHDGVWLTHGCRPREKKTTWPTFQLNPNHPRILDHWSYDHLHSQNCLLMSNHQVWTHVNSISFGDIQNYFTSSDPHHDMLGGGCQVRVVIKNMMGRMENLRTLISGFLGLVILVRWALVTMFLSWTTQTGCRIHRTYVSLIGSGEGRHTTHLLKCVLLLSTSQTDWKQSSDVLSDISFDILSDKSSDISSDILSDISSDILSDIFLTYLLTFFLTNLLTLFLTYLLTFFLTYQNQNLTSTASQKKPLCKLYIYLAPRSKSNIHDNFAPVNVIALSASDRPAKRQLSPKMQNACSSTHTHTPHASDRPAKRQLSPKMQKSLKCHNYISWRAQTMKSDARHCGACAGSA